uniref:Uncharacterized protein n=1 Tax=Anguilla anguilla TaxID=7936 RepID=A0A0E9XD23_ANGAN
MFWICLAYI